MWIQQLITLINVFYLSILLGILFVLLSFSFYYKEKIKGPAFYWLIFYAFLNFFLCNAIGYIYAEDLILISSSWLQENFIVRDPNDWVWSLITLSIFLSLIFFFPYFMYILYIVLKDIFYTHQLTLFKFTIISLIYYIVLSAVFLTTDFVFAGLNSFNDNDKIPFELQPDIDNFLGFCMGTYWDFFYTALVIQFYFFVSYLKDSSSQSIIERIPNIFIRSIVLFLLYYWFGGENLLQDCFFVLITIFCMELFLWLNIFISILIRNKV